MTLANSSFTPCSASYLWASCWWWVARCWKDYSKTISLAES